MVEELDQYLTRPSGVASYYAGPWVGVGGSSSNPYRRSEESKRLDCGEHKFLGMHVEGDEV